MITIKNFTNGKLPLPLPHDALDPDQWPSLDEVMHWSGRMSHAALALGIGLGVALVLHLACFAFLRRVARRSENPAEAVAAAQLYHAFRWAFLAGGMASAAGGNKLVAKLWGGIEGFAVPALTGWVLYALVRTAAELMTRRAITSGDELTARSRTTRIALISRTMTFLIVFVTVSLMLLGVPAVRHIGATLIASAGLMGLAVGAAAQPALKSLIAGLQIALTEPIRIGDFVVVEGEQGRVEDIRLSYVVVRTGDERRLIVPTVKFLDATFQNWTRVGGITGSVVLPIRPGFAIEPIRQAFCAMIDEMPSWDRRTGDLVVAESRVGSVELKLIVSAANPTDLATLRGGLREQMLEWLRVNVPDALCTET